MAKFKDLTGSKFGRLEALRHCGWYKTSSNTRIAKWLCLCSCGKEIEVIGSSLSYGNTQSCGCLRKEFPRNKLPLGQSAFNNLYKRYKDNAKIRGFDFQLLVEEFRELINKHCSVCGIEPLQIYKGKTCNGSIKYNGIDRMDNNLGYVTTNVITMCKVCNRAKRDLTQTEFSEWLKRIRNYNVDGK